MSQAAAPDPRGAQTSLRAALLGGATGLALLVAGLAAGGRTLALWQEHGAGPVAPGTGVEMLALGLTALVAGWLALLLGAGAASVLPGRVSSALRAAALTVGPRAVPRVASLLLAVTATSTSAVVAQAVPPHTVTAVSQHLVTGIPQPTAPVLSTGSAVPLAQASGSASPDHGNPTRPAPEPGWEPTAPDPTPSPETIALVSRGAAPPEEVVVVSGDTLWDIAARHLGAGATVEQIAAEWPRWYAANQGVIGPDPDLILPGTRLAPPGSPGESDTAEPAAQGQP